MATRSTIGIVTMDTDNYPIENTEFKDLPTFSNTEGTPKIKYSYCHFDGYISNNGILLYFHYNTEEKVNELINKGAIRSLDKTVEKTEFYNEDVNPPFDDVDDYLASTQEYNYLFINGEWYYFKNENYHNIRPLSECFEIKTVLEARATATPSEPSNDTKKIPA